MLSNRPRGFETKRKRTRLSAKEPADPDGSAPAVSLSSTGVPHGLFCAAGILACALVLNGCSVGYLLHLGRGQMKIVCGSECIEDVLIDPDVPEWVKGKIRLVLEAKAFGERQVGLAPSKNYTSYYAVKNPPVAYNLTASPRLELEAYRWCFPIAGCLPYKGFFDHDRAVREADKMSERGFDTYLRPVAAYSTLGWFRDPIFSTMLAYGDTALVEVILHEMVHRTIFVKHQGAFNEGVATFVGEKAAEAFFRTRRAEEPGAIERLREKRETARVFQETMFQLDERLRALYGSEGSEAEKLRSRQKIFEETKASLRERLEQLGSTRYEGILSEDWNNAFLVSYLTYHPDPDLWEALYERFDEDLKAMVVWLKGLEKEDDPFSAVRSLLKGSETVTNH